MTTQFPVHPHDVEQLLKIRRYLIGFRKTNGWTQPQLSQMVSGTDGMVWDLESNLTWQWRLSRLQDWTTPFGLRLTAVLRFPDDPALEQRVQEHPEVAPMLSLSRAMGAWKRWQGIYLTSSLRVARMDLGISAQDMGDRLGVSAKAVWAWENSADEVMLAKVLDYARKLDGFVEMGLEEEVVYTSE